MDVYETGAFHTLSGTSLGLFPTLSRYKVDLLYETWRFTSETLGFKRTLRESILVDLRVRTSAVAPWLQRVSSLWAGTDATSPSLYMQVVNLD